MARTAIQAVAMVSSLVDTQESIVIEPRAEVRSLSRRHLFWAHPAGGRRVPRRRRNRGHRGLCPARSWPASATAWSATTPASAPRRARRRRCSSQSCPPTPSRSSRDCRSTVRRPTTATARCCSSRCAHPSSACWSGGSGGTTGAVDPKSYADLYATETPQQQKTRGQRDMRTAKETAEYVALNRLGFDAKLTPGDVIIDELVCLKASDDGRTCVRVRAVRQVARSRRQVVEGRRYCRCRWSTTSRRSWPSTSPATRSRSTTSATASPAAVRSS